MFSLNESSHILNFRLLDNCSEYEPLDLVTFPESGKFFLVIVVEIWTLIQHNFVFFFLGGGHHSSGKKLQ